MSSDLIVNVSPSEVVIALLENKALVELNRETAGAKFAVGDIYLGRVKKIMPSKKKRKRHNMATHKRKKRLRKNRHKKKK